MLELKKSSASQIHYTYLLIYAKDTLSSSRLHLFHKVQYLSRPMLKILKPSSQCFQKPHGNRKTEPLTYTSQGHSQWEAEIDAFSELLAFSMIQLDMAI